MPPCCHIPPAGFFHSSLLTDTEVFSRWVAGQWPLIAVARTPHLTSALHVDLKLWQSAKPLPRKFILNDVRGNAWQVARPQLTRDPFRIAVAAKNQIWNSIHAGPPKAAPACAMLVFDQWLLRKIEAIRASALGMPGAYGLAGINRPSMLTTVGMCQKLINISTKYHVCWHVAGQFNHGAPNAAPYPNSAFIAPFICAYHSPIDSILINALRPLSLGRYWVTNGLLDRTRAKLRDSTGAFRPWSKLDCLRTYYGFQLMLRRIAMATWPKGCACMRDLIAVCAKGFEECFPDQKTGDGPDWIQAALDLPDEVAAETAVEIAALATRGAEQSKLKIHKAPRVQFFASTNLSSPISGRRNIRSPSPKASTNRKTVKKTYITQSFQPGGSIEAAFASANKIKLDSAGHVPNGTVVTLFLGAKSFECRWNAHGSILDYDRKWFGTLGAGCAISCSFDSNRNAVIVNSVTH